MNPDIASVLQSELSRRCKANPRYSLRAFARTLGVSPANLSLILNRKREASLKTVARALARLELSARDKEILSGRAWTPELGENIDFALIEHVASWLAYAILSLIKTKGFRTDEKWIARKLSVSVNEVRATVEALRSAGLLEGWRRSKSSLRVNNAVSTSFTRSFQRQLMEKALVSMENDPPALRDISSITFAMSADQLTEAKQEIRRFRLRMAEIFEKQNESTDVYTLTVQLVPVTKGDT